MLVSLRRFIMVSPNCLGIRTTTSAKSNYAVGYLQSVYNIFPPLARQFVLDKFINPEYSYRGYNSVVTVRCAMYKHTHVG